MLHNFFLLIPKKDDVSNEIIEATSPTESTECSTDIESTSQLAKAR